MKKFTLFFLFSSFAVLGFSKTWTVGNSNFTFSPSNITIQNGDTVKFTIASIHTVVEVSESTWNNNNNNPLSGGFELPNGGGTILPAKLTVGTHWYVCGPHASSGMKGKIIVEGVSGTDTPASGLALSLSPNPSTGKIRLSWSGLHSISDYHIDIMDINGKNVYSAEGTGEHGTTQYTDIDLSGYPEGTYIVRLHNSDGIQTKKLILQ
jgi:plastocyanin